MYIPTCPLVILKNAVYNKKVPGKHVAYVNGLLANPVQFDHLDNVTAMSSTSQNTWTLFPSNEAASKTLEKHFNNNIAVEILAENGDDVNTQLVDANYWAVTFPKKPELLVFPMEIVFALGTATPINTHWSLRSPLK